MLKKQHKSRPLSSLTIPRQTQRAVRPTARLRLGQRPLQRQGQRQRQRQLHNKSPLTPIVTPVYASNTAIAHRRRRANARVPATATLPHHQQQAALTTTRSPRPTTTRPIPSSLGLAPPRFAMTPTIALSSISESASSNSAFTLTGIAPLAPTAVSHRNYRVHPMANIPNPFPTLRPSERRNCWWRITRDGREMGYIEFHLFDEFANNAVRHFRELCRGNETTGFQAITLKGTYIHGIWPGNWMAGGDLIGTMGRSKQGGIVGGIFDVDILAMMNYKNNRPGLISFSCDGERFGSLWRIAFEASPFTDATSLVFGEIVKGWDIIKELENTRTNARSQPLVPIMISDCGECPY